MTASYQPRPTPLPRSTTCSRRSDPDLPRSSGVDRCWRTDTVAAVTRVRDNHGDGRNYPLPSGELMEQRLSLVTLGVADVRRARRFYEQLGWRGQESRRRCCSRRAASGSSCGAVTSSRRTLASTTPALMVSEVSHSPTTFGRLLRLTPPSPAPPMRGPRSHDRRARPSSTGVRGMLHGSRRTRVGGRIQPGVPSGRRGCHHHPRLRFRGLTGPRVLSGG